MFDNTKGVVSLYNRNVAESDGNNGWTDLLVTNVDEKTLRSVIVEQVESVVALNTINKINGRTIIVKSYHAPNYALAKPFDNGGGMFIYDASKSDINDDGITINIIVNPPPNNIAFLSATGSM